MHILSNLRRSLHIALVVVATATVVVCGVLIRNLLSSRTPNSLSRQPFSVWPSAVPILTEISTWKPYQNRDYRFAIHYPADWYAKQYDYAWSRSHTFTLLFAKGQEPTSIEPFTHNWPSLSISIGKTLHSDEEFKYLPPEKFSYKKVALAGVPASKVVETYYSMLGDPPYTRITFNAQGYGWTITYPNIDASGGHDPVYDRILSTLTLADK